MKAIGQIKSLTVLLLLLVDEELNPLCHDYFSKAEYK